MMKTVWNVALAAALFVVPTACKKDDHAREADKAADQVKKTTDDLNDQAKDVAKEQKDVVKEQKDVDDKSTDVAKATTEFEKQKALRVNDLETSFASIAVEPKNITSVAATTPLTDKARTDLNEKLKILQMRLDETRNAIDNLKASAAPEWNDRDNRASDALKRLEDARDDAKKSLDKGERVRAS